MTPYEKLKRLREKVEREKDVVLPIDKQHIINNLKNVYDPEMSGVNIYELGLIYTIDTDEKEGRSYTFFKLLIISCLSIGSISSFSLSTFSLNRFNFSYGVIDFPFFFC